MKMWPNMQFSATRRKLTRELYDTLQMKLKEASVTAGMSAANITVVDRAEVPFVPVAPQKRHEPWVRILRRTFDRHACSHS